MFAAFTASAVVDKSATSTDGEAAIPTISPSATIADCLVFTNYPESAGGYDRGNGRPISEGSLLTDEAMSFFIYFGSTSALGGSRNTNVYRSNPRFSKGVLTLRRDFLDLDQPSSQSRLSIESMIPCPLDLINHLIKSFFEQFHPVFPMIDKEEFFRLLEETISEGTVEEDKKWPQMLLLTSLVTVMLQFTPSLKAWGIQEGPEILAMRCLANAKKLLYEHLDASCVMAVQSMVLLAMSAAGRKGRGTITWTLLGLAVRKAQELGLHRDIKGLGIHHPTLTESVLETRRRTWFCVLIAETYTCIMTGRPLAIHPNDWDTDYPKNDNEDIQNLLRHVELAGIFGSICRFANRARPVDREIFIADIESKLTRWYSIVETSWLSDVWNKWDSRAFMLLIVAYNRIDDAVCLRSAQAVTKMLAAFPAIDLNSDLCCVIFPTVNYGLLMTCTVWIARLMSDGSQETLNNVKRCLDAFDNLRGLLSGANKGWKIVTEYLQMKGIRLPTDDNSGDRTQDNRGDDVPSVHPSPRASRIPMDSLLNGGARGFGDTQNMVAPSDPSLLLGPNSSHLLGLDLGMWWDGTNLFDLAGLGGLVSDAASLASGSTLTPDPAALGEPSPMMGPVGGNSSFVVNGFGTPPPSFHHRNFAAQPQQQLAHSAYNTAAPDKHPKEFYGFQQQQHHQQQQRRPF
ncbi:hypothetical protein HDU97_002310 [Phlyctochytrium planicorne]|nr:hypothetical protein HDU97_002310 [Phlyctochytrium planicorne]